jgi:uncharacterized protein (DUF1697 family)
VSRYAILLRAVNLGSHQKVSMPDLRKALESLGYADVGTYMQSGNAVVTSSAKDPAQVAKAVHKGLRDELGLDTPVLVRTASELATVIAGNPYPELVATPTKLHVVFLSAQPEAASVAKLDPARYLPDEFQVGERVLYVSYPGGAGRSKLTATAFARLGVEATARNWNTVTALAEMTAG